MTDSLRDALEAAYDTEGEEEENTLTEQEAQIEEEAAAPAEGEVSVETEGAPTEVEATEEAPEATKEESGSAATAEAPDSQVPTSAPAGWRGAAKQQWDKLPPDVQGEVWRREKETSSVLRETSEARRFVDEFEKVVTPFKPFMEAENSNPMQAFQNLMQTAAGLRTGTQAQKASTIAGIIKQYGVDIETLDSVLAGEAPSVNPEQDHLARMLDERLAPVNQFMQTLEQSKAQTQQQAQIEVQNEIAAFESDPANMYLEDVRQDMSILLDAAAAQRRPMSLQQAYEAALTLHPELKSPAPQSTPVVGQTGTQSLARKKLAAASVPGARQAPQVTTPDDSLRGALSAAWDATGQR